MDWIVDWWVLWFLYEVCNYNVRTLYIGFSLGGYFLFEPLLWHGREGSRAE